MSECNLIKIDAVKTLIESVKDAIGVLYEPTRIRRKADAEAYALQVKERTRRSIEEENEIANLEMIERIRERKASLEITRQQNIDDVVSNSMHLLANEQIEELDKNLNKDWMVRFFDIVQDISDKEMKEIWAQILASEVKSPDSFSFRTMELLRNITKSEAMLFMKIAKYVLSTDNDYFILKDKNGELKEFGIMYEDIANLVEAGFIHPESNIQITFNFPTEDTDTISIHYGKKVVECKVRDKMMVIPSLPIYSITTFGKEILRLIEIESSEDYIHFLETKLKGYIMPFTIK